MGMRSMKFAIRVHDQIEWRIVELDDEEVAGIQNQHKIMSKEIMVECVNEVADPERQIALFNKRCPSFIELINQKLEERAAYLVKTFARKISSKGEEWYKGGCPYCKKAVKKYYNATNGYRWYCGYCHKFKVKMEAGEKIPQDLI